MENRRHIIIVTVLMFLVAVMGCQATTGKTAGETVDDATITTKINSEIVKDSELGYLKIDVDTHQGDVMLSGTVPNKDAEKRLIKIAEGVRGVKSVTSNLKIEME